MPLYEVAILEKPTQKEAEEGKSERLVLGPKAVVANDPQSAAISAVLDALSRSPASACKPNCYRRKTVVTGHVF
jgi:hypothetical protein